MRSFATVSRQCTGNCRACGKTHIKIFGAHDAASGLLGERVRAAIAATALDAKVLDIADPVAIQAHGIRQLPALMIEGATVSEGAVPNASDIERFLKNKDVFRSKIYRLHTLSVAVDMSEVSAGALVFAWKLAQKLHSRLEIVYAMDSIFSETASSASGFLSGYTHTMQTALEAFVSKTLADIGVDCQLPARFAGEPGEGRETPLPEAPQIAAKVIYGTPDYALTEYSRLTDFLVMGATGRGGVGQRLFGSVSAELSKNAHCPVLFVPEGAVFTDFSNLLYSADFDSLQDSVVRQALSFSQRFDAQTHFVHVATGQAKRPGQHEAFKAIYAESGSDKPFIFSQMLSENVVGALYEYAFYHRTDLLLFVTQQRTFWENILHKSVTAEALGSTSLPMLVLHADDDLF